MISPLKRFLMIVAMTAMWSPSFLFIKWALTDLRPFTIAASRVSFAALLLLGVLAYRRVALPRSLKTWGQLSGMALFSSAIPFSLFSYAEMTIDSSMAAMVNASTPIFTALLAQFFIPTDRLSSAKVIGISLSSIGLVWLLGPALMQSYSGPSLGLLAAAGASFSYAVSHIYGKKFMVGHAAFVAPAGQMICSSVILTPFALAFEKPLEMATLSLYSILGISGLSLCGTFFAFILYYRLLEQAGPTAISMAACFFPVAAMLLGYFVLGESLSLEKGLAGGLIVIGVMIVNEVIPLKRLMHLGSPALDSV